MAGQRTLISSDELGLARSPFLRRFYKFQMLSGINDQASCTAYALFSWVASFAMYSNSKIVQTLSTLLSFLKGCLTLPNIERYTRRANRVHCCLPVNSAGSLFHDAVLLRDLHCINMYSSDTFDLRSPQVLALPGAAPCRGMFCQASWTSCALFRQCVDMFFTSLP